MKLIRNNNFSLYFLKRSGSLGLWLLWMSFSVNSMAQIHVSGNTVFTVKENTSIYMAGGASEITSVNVKKYKSATNRKTIVKKAKKDLNSLPMAKKDTAPEKRTGVLSFTSKQKEPSALFYSGKTTKAALVHSGNFGVKSFPPKKHTSKIIHTFLLDVDQQIKTSFADTLPKPQIHLEEHITRPPPYHSVRV